MAFRTLSRTTASLALLIAAVPGPSQAYLPQCPDLPAKLTNFALWDWSKNDPSRDCPLQTLPVVGAVRLRCHVTAAANGSAYVDLIITTDHSDKSRRNELLRCAAGPEPNFTQRANERSITLAQNTVLHCELRINGQPRPPNGQPLRGGNEHGSMFCSAEFP